MTEWPLDNQEPIREERASQTIDKVTQWTNHVPFSSVKGKGIHQFNHWLAGPMETGVTNQSLTLALIGNLAFRPTAFKNLNCIRNMMKALYFYQIVDNKTDKHHLLWWAISVFIAINDLQGSWVINIWWDEWQKVSNDAALIIIGWISWQHQWLRHWCLVVFQ